MCCRLVHHADIIVLKGDSYRLKDKQEEVIAAEDTRLDAQTSTCANRAVFDRRRRPLLTGRPSQGLNRTGFQWRL